MLVADSSPDGTPERWRPERPPSCLRCEASSWWNGWREVFVVDGLGARCGRWLARSKCSACRHSFTCYPPGHYPHRQYQLDIVGDVVAAVVLGGETPATAAAHAGASPTSGRRWTAWVAQLAVPSLLLAVAQRLDPGAIVGAGVSMTGPGSDIRSLAAHVLDAFEQLGAALVHGGVALASRTGLGRVLEWQHRQHRDVVYVVAEPRHLSPGMALGPSGGCL